MASATFRFSAAGYEGSPWPCGERFRRKECSGTSRKSRPDEQGRRLRPALSGEKLPELIKGLSVKAPAAKPRSTTGALMPQDELGSEPAPYHWRGFERKHSPGSES